MQITNVRTLSWCKFAESIVIFPPLEFSPVVALACSSMLSMQMPSRSLVLTMQMPAKDVEMQESEYRAKPFQFFRKSRKVVARSAGLVHITIANIAQLC
eukprot:79715-Pleurochrysis_carterae.AAC.1